MANLTHSATGAAAVNTTLTKGTAGYFESFKIHLSAAGAAGNLIIKIDNGLGATYDVPILTQDMTLITDIYWQPVRPIRLKSTDTVVITWANASTRTYALEVEHS